jgi:SnoaL-like domain
VADFGPYGKLEGRAAIVAASREAQGTYERRGGMQHVLANLELELQGDTAVGSSNVSVIVTLNSAKTPPDYAFGGKYRWTFARTGEGWQIERAELSTTWATGPDIAGVNT